jgi:hypothetical protein
MSIFRPLCLNAYGLKDEQEKEVKISLLLIKYRNMKTFGGVEV